MLEVISRALRRLRRDERGNVFVLFGVTSIPLLLIMGGAVDIARFTRYKAELSNAVDAAVLALARKGDDYTNDQANTFVQNYIAAFHVTDSEFQVTSLDVTKMSDGYRVNADGAMHTIFLPLGAFIKGGSGGPITSMGMNIVAEAVHASSQVELALVLDNTGSMNCGETESGGCTNNWNNPSSDSRIVGLKNAADQLVDTLMTQSAIDGGYIKVGVVPFEGAVNIKNASLDYSWLDWNDVGQAKYNGVNFNNYDVDTSNNSCTQTSGGGHWEYQWRSGWVWVQDPPTTTCTQTTERVGHKWLFDQLHADDSSVEWAGCVEMRAEPYDMSDTAPDPSNPDTLFVPFFWPDEPDSGSYTNNYLYDDTSQTGSAAQKYTDKYLTSNVRWRSGKKDTTFPYQSGPNYGCPRPILPLTNDKQAVQNELNSMIAYPAMGTYIPAGLVWGWRVLSHGAPFTEGVGPGDQNYSKTVKALVLLSDGENSVTGISNSNKSIFSGYNYVATRSTGSRASRRARRVRRRH